MHIATVIPIGRGIPFDTLTYYAPENLAGGTLVAVPFGKTTINGLVVETIPLVEAKTFVKHATFSLKKIKSVVGYAPYFHAIIEALRETGVITRAPIGAVASTVIPQSFFEYGAIEKTFSLLNAPPIETFSETKRAIVGTQSTRVDEYKRLIRTSFAVKQSVLFIAPTIRSLEWWKKELEKGIGRHTMVFHSKITKKVLKTQFSGLKHDANPLLIFATPNFSMLPVHNIGTIVLEDESSNLYRSADRYMIDSRIFFESFAGKTGAVLLFGDTLPRFETLYKAKADKLPRTFIPDKLHIVPIEPYRTVLPTEVIELIRHAEKKKKRLFIYTNRKGIAPISRCADCGTLVECPTCSLPMALRNKITHEGKERLFICLHCSTTLSPDFTCSYCGGWNIVPVAVGTESIADAVAHIVEKENVITIDDDLSPDSKTIESLLQTIEAKKFAVVIGTQKALPYIKRIHYAIVPFFDRLLSIPSLYTTETLLRLIMECNERVVEGVVICTKTPGFPFIQHLETKKIGTIVTEELELRKQLGYPPFGTLLKIMLTTPENKATETIEQVQTYLQSLDYTILPIRRLKETTSKVLISWLVKVSNDYLEEEGSGLTQFFESLRFPYIIDRNPDRL